MLRCTRWWTDSSGINRAGKQLRTAHVDADGAPARHAVTICVPMPSDLEQRPYKLYRAGPKGLRARLRGEDDELQRPGRVPEIQGRT